MSRRESQYFSGKNAAPPQTSGKAPPVARPHRPAEGGDNTWLGDSEEFYDAYDREPYTREDCAKYQGRYYRYEEEYPREDQGRSGFSLNQRSPRHDKDTRH